MHTRDREPIHYTSTIIKGGVDLKQRRFLLLSLLFILTTVLTGVLRILFSSPNGSSIDEVEEAAVTQATFVFAGDVMIHDSQLEAAYYKEDDKNCFFSCFEKVKPFIKLMDLAIVNLETTLSGAAQEYSGYPVFNAPESLALALKDAGFDLVSTANNHSLDRGE